MWWLFVASSSSFCVCVWLFFALLVGGSLSCEMYMCVCVRKGMSLGRAASFLTCLYVSKCACVVTLCSRSMESFGPLVLASEADPTCWFVDEVAV